MTLVQWAIHEKLTRTVALQRAQSAQEPMNEFSSDCLTTICFLTLITLCNLKRKAGRGRGVSCGSNLLKGTTGVKPWKAYGGEIPSGFVQPPGLSRAPEPAGNGPRQPRGVVHWDYFWNILPPEIRENLENQVPLFWCLYFKGGHFWPTIVSFLWATRLRTSETMETETESTVVVIFLFSVWSYLVLILLFQRHVYFQLHDMYLQTNLAHKYLSSLENCKWIFW